MKIVFGSPASEKEPIEGQTTVYDQLKVETQLDEPDFRCLRCGRKDSRTLMGALLCLDCYHSDDE